MSPRVSVILPAFNSEDFINEAIESVLNQSYADFELIVVNDGSTDNTEKIVEKYLVNFSDKIKYIYQENKGHAAARNTGIRASDGEFVAFLDSDDLWLAGKLNEQMPVFNTYPDVGIVHTNVYAFGGIEGTYVNRYWMTPEQIRKHSGYIFFEYYLRNIRITTSTVIIRRNCLDRVGIFDENLSKLGSEDRDLFLRILWYYNALYIHKPLGKYRDRSDSAGQNYEKVMKGQEYVYEKITRLYKLPKSCKKKALSTVYFEWSNRMYDSFDFVKGIKLQLHSIRFNPVNIYSYKLTAKMMKCIWNYFVKRIR